MKKEYKELTFTNDFIFPKVMLNPEICRKLLEVILNVEIGHIEYPERQKTIDEKYDARGIRLDVYVKDGSNTVYNVEMQTADLKNLPKRSRYYQGLIDLDLLNRGEDYRKLNRSYVIFICLSDFFSKGRHIYTFENRCIQDAEIALTDETVKIFLNPHSEMEDVSPELVNFLKYIADGLPVDAFTERLAAEVERAKNNRQWEIEYKSFYVKQQEIYEEGLDKGRIEGLQALVRTLKHILVDFDKVYEEIVKNEPYADVKREEVMEYYQIC